MKNHLLARTLGLLTALLAPAVAEAAFVSGSTGLYGPLTVTSNTVLDLPPDGVFHCTTITVNPGMTLSFNRNALNTPVHLLATGDVSISGAIELSGSAANGGAPGSGGPGGFDGGFGGYGIGAFSQGGDGSGPGGGRSAGGFYGAAYATASNSNTNTYGNALCYPLIGGSGGAGSGGNPGLGGGGGGGAILVASSTKITLNGVIRARGAYGAGGGSGGTIRLVSPIVTGGGSCDTSGAGSAYGNGALGRTRIDCEDRFAFRSLSFPSFSSRGSQMFVVQPTVPRLDILRAAGTTIAEGSGNSVQIQLPANAPTNQTVTIQARDFTGPVPIRLVVTPENGPASRIDTTISMDTNPSQTNLNIVVPVGQFSRIHVWTRQN